MDEQREEALFSLKCQEPRVAAGIGGDGIRVPVVASPASPPGPRYRRHLNPNAPFFTHLCSQSVAPAGAELEKERRRRPGRAAPKLCFNCKIDSVSSREEGAN